MSLLPDEDQYDICFPVNKPVPFIDDKWMIENIGTVLFDWRSYFCDDRRYWFRKKEDAALFRIMYGGECVKRGRVYVSQK